MYSQLPAAISGNRKWGGILSYMWISLVAQTVKCLSVNAGDLGLIPGSGRFPGEGNGNLLHYSCLENPMDGGPWCRTVHGVAKSRTWLSNFTLLLSYILLWAFETKKTNIKTIFFNHLLQNDWFSLFCLFVYRRSHEMYVLLQSRW